MSDSVSASTAGARPEGAASDHVLLAAGALLFVASAWLSISACRSMSGGGMPMPGGWTMTMAWMPMPGQSRVGAAASFAGMWIVMMIAMMLPSLMPALAAYRRSIRPADAGADVAVDFMRSEPRTVLAAAGYFAVWTVFGIAAYPLGVLLAAAAMRWPAVSRSVPLAGAFVLVAAGSLQFTVWKADHLRRCREAPACDGPVAPDLSIGWKHGLRLGAHCSLCCSGFMAVLFVMGVMDLRAMAIVAAVITFERLSPRPRLAARAIGVALIAGGIFGIARVLVMP